MAAYPLIEIAYKLLTLKLKAERLDLLKKIRLAESQGQLEGVNVGELATLKKALCTQSLPALEPTLEGKPPPARGLDAPLRHIRVRRHKGSAF